MTPPKPTHSVRVMAGDVEAGDYFGGYLHIEAPKLSPVIQNQEPTLLGHSIIPNLLSKLEALSSAGVGTYVHTCQWLDWPFSSKNSATLQEEDMGQLKC